MPRKKSPDKVIVFPTYLKRSQADWIIAHPSFKIHKFIRDKVDIYIQDKEVIETLI